MNSNPIGIHAIGVYLPEEIRSNDYWSAKTVAGWKSRGTRGLQPDLSKVEMTEDIAATLDAMRLQVEDPFRGARTRRVAPRDMPSSAMELAAAQDALRRSGVDKSKIAALFVHSTTPDFLNTPQASLLHHELGLAERCYTLSMESMCNAFQQQLELACAMLRGQPGRYALLIQSSTLPRLLPPDEPISAWFGEGATAVLVGPVGDGHGVMGTSHYTDGSKFRGLVVGIPNGRWYDGGKIEAYAEDRHVAQGVVLGVAAHARIAIGTALSELGLAPADVDFYASHQGTEWLRAVTQARAGLHNARSVDTFSQYGSLSGANIPLVLAVAERERTIRAGDLTVLFSGGSGETWSATVLRWGIS